MIQVLHRCVHKLLYKMDSLDIHLKRPFKLSMENVIGKLIAIAKRETHSYESEF